MPRLSPHLLHAARKRDPLLPLLLRACRDLPSAASELRWLHDHVNTYPSPNHNHFKRDYNRTTHLRNLCIQRSYQKPLQYILGDTPFGDLSIQCRPGVLIPRWETAEYTTNLAYLLITRSEVDRTRPLRILDLCTGTGCIPLLLHSLLHPHFPRLDCLGVDISSKAVSLARRNIKANITAGTLQPDAKEQIRFQQADISCDNFLHSVSGNRERWDIMISNPPYISPIAFQRTSRSVRNWEPLSALVPPRPQAALKTENRTVINDENIGDAFYPRLLHIAEMVCAKIALFEVADIDQATRVVRNIRMKGRGAAWEGCEIWRDLPAAAASNSAVEVEGTECVVRGHGNGRSVMMWMEDGKDFIGRRNNG